MPVATPQLVPGKSRVLLLTATPPGLANVGEIILRDIALHHGVENLRCAAVVDPGYPWVPDPRLRALTVDMLYSKHFRAQRRGPSRLGAMVGFWNYLTGFRADIRRLGLAIVQRVATDNIDSVFAVLNSPLMLPLAHRVASYLDKPLVTLVWDAPGYTLRLAGFDRFSRAMILRDFTKCLRNSSRVAVVSENMQADYAQLTAAPISILRHGVRADYISTKPNSVVQGEEWVIGFAGSMYAGCAWRSLLGALDSCQWRIGDRSVRIKLLTSKISIATSAEANIEYLGYRTPEAAQLILGNCHLCYLPQPFAASEYDLRRYSFPTKLSSYLAIGRPVFVHCPSDSALSLYFDRHRIGTRATSLVAADIIVALESLLGDESAYAAACAEAVAVAATQFAEAPFFREIDALLELPSSSRALPKRLQSTA